MIVTKYLLIADRVVIDAQSNQVFILGVLEEAQSASFPLLIPRISAVWALDRDANDPETPAGQMTISLGGVVLHTIDVNIDFQGKLRQRSLVTIGGLVLPNPGELEFVFSLAGQALARYSMPLQQSGQPTVQVAAS